MTLEERKALALKLLSEIDNIEVAPGFEQLKLDMEALIREIAVTVEKGEEVEVGDV